jgi:hypothetical protein
MEKNALLLTSFTSAEKKILLTLQKTPEFTDYLNFVDHEKLYTLVLEELLSQTNVVSQADPVTFKILISEKFYFGIMQVVKKELYQCNESTFGQYC